MTFRPGNKKNQDPSSTTLTKATQPHDDKAVVLVWITATLFPDVVLARLTKQILNLKLNLTRPPRTPRDVNIAKVNSFQMEFKFRPRLTKCKSNLLFLNATLHGCKKIEISTYSTGNSSDKKCRLIKNTPNPLHQLSPVLRQKI